MSKLRLLVTTKCNRHCVGCCNNSYDLENLPVAHDNDEFLKYSEIIITGGEPMLNPYEVVKLVNRLRSITDAKLILYTAVLPLRS